MAETEQKQKLTLKALNERLAEIEEWKGPTRWAVIMLNKGQDFVSKHVYDYIVFKKCMNKNIDDIAGWMRRVNQFMGDTATRFKNIEQAQAPSRAEFEALKAELETLKLKLARLDAAEQIDGAEKPNAEQTLLN